MRRHVRGRVLGPVGVEEVGSTRYSDLEEIDFTQTAGHLTAFQDLAFQMAGCVTSSWNLAFQSASRLTSS